MVEDFENAFAKFCSTEYCVGVGSGTDALRFALTAAGVKTGDAVITVPNTFIATTEAISQAGANIVFVDINEQTYNIDINKVREYIETQCDIDEKTGNPLNRKTRSLVTAIIPVHLYGQMADMDPIMELAERYNLKVIEDACQAHGAEYLSKKTLPKNPPPQFGTTGGGQGEHEPRWRRAGSIGNAAAFSFYPGKNLGACGEAGAATTNDEQISRMIKTIRDHGQAKKYYHDIEGYNGRLDAIQAGLLRVKLNHLEEWNQKRRQAATIYNNLFGEMNEIIIPIEPKWSKGVYHLYVIRVKDRDKLQTHLSEKGIATGLHYPLPLHLQKAYEHLGYKKGDFPITEKVASEILSLPMFPGLTEEQQKYIKEKIKEANLL